MPALALVIAVAGTGARVFAALYPLEAPTPDAKIYAELAENLWASGTYSAAVPDPNQYAPGAPLLYAAVYAVSGGPDEAAARMVVALLGFPTILLAYVLGARVANMVVSSAYARAAGLLAAALLATWPVLIVFASSFWGEPVAIPLILAALLGVLWAFDGGDRWRWLVPGLALGAAAMFRPEYVAVTAVLAIVVFGVIGHRAGVLRGAIAALLLLVGMAVVLAPWTVRNALVLERFVPVSTGGGKAVFIGTYVPARGIDVTVKRRLLQTYPWLRRQGATGTVRDAEVAGAKMDALLARLMARQYPGVPHDEALSRAARANLDRWLRDRPREVAEVAAFKVWRMWRRGPRAVSRHPAVYIAHQIVVVLGLAGLVILAHRRRAEVLLFAAILVTVTLIAVVLIATPRRSVPLMPLIFVLAATGTTWIAAAAHQRLTWLGRRLPERRRAEDRA